METRVEKYHSVKKVKTSTYLKITTLLVCGSVLLPYSNGIINREDVEQDNKVYASTKDMTASYIDKVSPHAQQVAHENGLYPSVMIAQSILESDWGRSHLTQQGNNYFGIKGNYLGNSLWMPTMEDNGKGQLYQINDSFRKYPSPTESFQDNARLLKNNPLYVGAWRENTSSYKDATRWLTGRYATDTSYYMKLNNIINTYNLTQYDAPIQTNNKVNKGIEKEQTTNTVPKNVVQETVFQKEVQETVAQKEVPKGNYIVESGDTLYRIALNNGITLEKLKEINNLDTNIIYVGQSLNVGDNGTQQKESVVEQEVNTVSTGNTEYHTVVRGDNLYRLGLKYGVDATTLMKWNNLSTDTIYLNQKIKVRQGNYVEYDDSYNKQESTGENTYTVKQGDNIYRIALNNGISELNLRYWNNLGEDNYLYVGQVLNLAPTTQAVGTKETITEDTYIVKKRDNLFRIAYNRGLNVQELKQKNNIGNDNMIYEGQELKL